MCLYLNVLARTLAGGHVVASDRLTAQVFLNP